MKKVLITGGAGFIGSHLSRRLLKEGHEVSVLDNLFTGNKSNIYELLSNPKFTFIPADVTETFGGQYDWIFNLACPASPIHYQRNPVETIRTSFRGMENVLERALKTKAIVFHTSTSEVYGDPHVHPQPETYWGNVSPIGPRSCYDEGKRAAETLCLGYYQEYGVDVRVVRIFNTYGPNMHPNDGRVISNFIMQGLRGEPITIFGSGNQTRSFQYVDDLLEAMMRYMSLEKDALAQYFKGELPVINTGNPGEFTIKQLAEMVIEKTGGKSQLVYQPLPRDDPKQRKPDIARAQEVLGWAPKITLDEGLDKTIPYFRDTKF